jgi:HNH endonuclease
VALGVAWPPFSLTHLASPTCWGSYSFRPVRCAFPSRPAEGNQSAPPLSGGSGLGWRASPSRRPGLRRPITRVCLDPDCPAITDGERYCPEHARAPWSGRRSPSAVATDSAEWQRARRRKRKRNPCCEQCGSTQRLEVHHIRQIAHGGSLTDPANLRTLCADCHAKIPKN